jgi:hypothetical protein
LHEIALLTREDVQREERLHSSNLIGAQEAFTKR